METVVMPLILGQFTLQELNSINTIELIMKSKRDELVILQNGLQHTLNKFSSNHGFPSQIRLDYKTGVVYSIPENSLEDESNV